MKAADLPVQRPASARLLAIDASGRMCHLPRAAFASLLRSGDLVIANDAATLPASLHGIHVPTGEAVEVRLAGRPTLAEADAGRFTAILFGSGDHRILTEHRPPPPRLEVGDRLELGPLSARIEALAGHPRMAGIRFDGTNDAIWAGIARHGRPIQYAHMPAPLALWDVWTPIAGFPAAFEPPSAGFALDWKAVAAIKAQGAAFATLTHAAGISSTGDEALDRRLPFPEPYRIPPGTAALIATTRRHGGRVIAIGTSVVRALEHAASEQGTVPAGDGLATQRIDRHTMLRVADAILSGTHEPGSSHFELLQAFADDDVLARADRELEDQAYRTHEFGDSVFIERRLAART
jgi:S-adenosylmethionine:tRNA ribosyltransferase-isomerase